MSWFQQFRQQGGSAESVLQLGKWALIAFAVGALLLWRLLPPRATREEREKGFRLREHERLGEPPPPGASTSSRASAQGAGQAPARPLALEGIRLDVPPHALLGVPVEAEPEEIQRAHRELMKRYHPDRVGRPDSREWRDAQAIAEALNRARGLLLEAAKRRRPRG